MKFSLLEALDQVGPVEHRGAAILIKPRHLFHPHSQCKTSGNDCACAGAGDVVEIITKHEVVATAELLFELTLDFSEHFERDYTTNTTTVERKKFRGPDMASLSLNEEEG